MAESIAIFVLGAVTMGALVGVAAMLALWHERYRKPEIVMVSRIVWKDERLDDLKRMREVFGASTNGEVIEHALTLTEWIIEHKQKGHAIGALCDGNVFSEVVYSPLENSKAK